MTPYIDKDDLAKHVSDINDHNAPALWVNQIQFATDDVLNKIKAEWWSEVSGPSLTINEALLNTDALTNLAIYCALGFYVLPYLSTERDKDGDSFSRKAEYYRARFKEEWEIVKELPLYDFDQDSDFEDGERQGPIVRTLSRG